MIGSTTGVAAEKARPNSRRVRVWYDAVGAICAALDASVMVLSAVLGGLLYHLAAHGSPGDPLILLGSSLCSAVLYVTVAAGLGHYRTRVTFDRTGDFRRMMLSWAIAWLLLFLLLFLLQVGATLSRGSTISAAGVTLVALGVARLVVRNFLQSAPRGSVIQGRRAVVVGTIEELASFSPKDLLRRFGLEEVERIQLSSRPHEPRARSAATALKAAVDLARRRGLDGICWRCLGMRPARLRSCGPACANRHFARLLPDRLTRVGVLFNPQQRSSARQNRSIS